LPFEDAPFGVLGLETSLSLSLTELGLPIEDVVGLLTWRPAKVALIDDLHGRPIAVGEPANLVVIDPNATWKRDKQTSQSRSKNDPFDGRTMKGMARHTIHHGVAVVIDGELTR
jgi:dihydroorotase